MSKIHLEENEEIIAIIKHSLGCYILEIVGVVLFILVPSYFAFWLFVQGFYGMMAFGFSLFIALLIFLKIIIGQTRNRSILTNQRLTNFKSTGFFDEEVLSINLYEIQNVLYFKKGLLAKIFNFGNLSLENSQRQELLRLFKISMPEKVFLIINKLKNDFWMEEKDLNTEEIIELFMDNLSVFETRDLVEVKECIEDILINRTKIKK
ncbi:MAG: hypothetical protein Q7J14_02165 [Candidatus Magasanikbacteria bacterium]|nr:hypothetical protein [Candidatus Magasanikbacteria bacterium]